MYTIQIRPAFGRQLYIRRMKYLMVPIPAVYQLLIIFEKRKWEINSRPYCQSLEFIENFPADLYLLSSHLYILHLIIHTCILYTYIYMMVLCYSYTFFSDFYHISITLCTQYLLLFFTVFSINFFVFTMYYYKILY